MVGDEPLESRARRQITRGWRGDFGGVDVLRSELAAAGEEAWVAALDGQAWLAGAGGAPVDAALAAVPGDGAVQACVHGQRAALLAFDGDAVTRWAELAAEAALDPSDGWVAATRCWAGLARGQTDSVGELASLAAEGARTGSDAPLAIESVVLRAIAALLDDDLDEATTLARRASRMARTESLPQQEYLANTVLARVRRLRGNAPLATRILTALMQVAPEPWRPWLAWELVLASGEDAPRVPLSEGRGATAVASLRRLLQAAREGDRTGYDEALGALREATAGRALVARDTETLAWTVDVSAGDPADAPDGIREWLSGNGATVPGGLHGVCPADSPETAAVVAPVGPPAPRRVLSAGLALAVVETGARVLEPTDNRQARTDSTVAALLLHGAEGTDEESLFQRVYGFPYEAAVHQGVRDVLYHRVRARLGEAAALERDGGRVRIEHAEPLAAYDPRCSPPPEHTLLQLLARAGHLTAKQAAELLGMPVRTAQHALRKLAEDGACRAEKDGRRLEYHLEDTTFMEPTTH